MRKIALAVAAWVTTFGFIGAIVAGIVAVVCSVPAAYYAATGNIGLFLTWGAFAAGAYVAATTLAIIATVLCVVLNLTDEEVCASVSRMNRKVAGFKLWQRMIEAEEAGL